MDRLLRLTISMGLALRFGRAGHRQGGMAEQFDERKSLLGAMLAKGKHAFIMRWLWVRKRIGRRLTNFMLVQNNKHGTRRATQVERVRQRLPLADASGHRNCHACRCAPGVPPKTYCKKAIQEGRPRVCPTKTMHSQHQLRQYRSTQIKALQPDSHPIRYCIYKCVHSIRMSE